MKDLKETTKSGVLDHTELGKRFSFSSLAQLIEIIESIDLEVQSGDIMFGGGDSCLCFNSSNKKELITQLRLIKGQGENIDKD